MSRISKTALIALILFLLPVLSYEQPKHLVHKPRTAVVIPGLRREFKAELANIRLGVNPGWGVEEIKNDSAHIFQLIFTDKEDSSGKLLSLLMKDYDTKGFDTTKWEELKKSIRISYGDRGIAVRPLSDKISERSTFDSTGILAQYELLTRHKEFIEYVDAIVGQTSLLLLSAPMKTEEYTQRIDYFRDVAQSIKFGKEK